MDKSKVEVQIVFEPSIYRFFWSVTRDDQLVEIDEVGPYRIVRGKLHLGRSKFVRRDFSGRDVSSIVSDAQPRTYRATHSGRTMLGLEGPCPVYGDDIQCGIADMGAQQLKLDLVRLPPPPMPFSPR